MNLIQKIQAPQLKPEAESFKVGDTIRVHFKIVEGKTERIQIYEGLCIAMKNAGIGRTFMVRKNSYGVGVERVFPMNSPRVEKVEVVKAGRVRRAKLYYIRSKIGKKAKIKELLPTHRVASKAEGSAKAAAKA